MWNRYSFILIVFAIFAGIAVAGCTTTTTTTTGSPTPTPEPGISQMTLKELYNLDGINSIQVRLIISGNEGIGTVTHKTEFRNTTYKGVDAIYRKDVENTVLSNGSVVGQMSGEAYTSKVDNSVLGGHVKGFVYERLIDEDLQAGSTIAPPFKLIFFQNMSTLNYIPVQAAGSEIIIIDGRSYTCTKYTYGDNYMSYTAWYTPEAPMPVRTTLIDIQKKTNTIELLEWS